MTGESGGHTATSMLWLLFAGGGVREPVLVIFCQNFTKRSTARNVVFCRFFSKPGFLAKMGLFLMFFNVWTSRPNRDFGFYPILTKF
jgi:hypothetical protein